MYEAYWESDDECDKEALAEVMRDNFISGLKKGDQMPLVLPVKNEPQFRRLLVKTAKSEIPDEHLASTSKMEQDDLCVNANLKQELLSDTEVETSPSKMMSLIEKKRFRAGKIFKKLLAENDTSLMLFQLPSSLGVLSDQVQRPGAVPASTTIEGSAKAPKQEQLLMQSSSANGVNRRGGKHCLHGLTTGAEIGKLQILRSGRIIMNIGGHEMDVAESIPSRCFETAVCIETENSGAGGDAAASPLGLMRGNDGCNVSTSLSKRNGFSTSTITTTLANNVCKTEPTTFEEPNPSSRNAIHILGEVPYSFVCSYDLRSTKSRRLAQQHSEQQKKRQESANNNNGTTSKK